MKKKNKDSLSQTELWIPSQTIAQSPSHPFVIALNRVLKTNLMNMWHPSVKGITKIDDFNMSVLMRENSVLASPMPGWRTEVASKKREINPFGAQFSDFMKNHAVFKQ